MIRLVFLIKLITLISSAAANEVLGCGGFIKSDADIDFSKVEIKLLTKQGSLKDKTDCSPSNGYYFLPIYDRGEYLLQISPPPGWSFEPDQVELNFDGQNDLCSQGKDVNFAFKGFGITGKVGLAGHRSTGARGVNIELRSEDGADVRHTNSDLNGVFSFTPIIPGKYVLKATHPNWHFSKAEHTVLVVSGNTELHENTLVVSGFDVVGRFDSKGQLTSGIGVAIFSKKGQTLQVQCDRGTPVTLSGNNINYETKSACYSPVDKAGDYIFSGVAPGKYLLQPVVKDPNVNMHITPSYLEFEVDKDTLVLKEPFRITGFSVSGKVLTAQGGSPIGGATVSLNGQKIGDTAVDGSYTLQNLKTGAYSLQVEAPKLQFKEQQMLIQLGTSQLADIVPAAYEVCGKVISRKSYVVGIVQHGSTFHTTVSSKAESGEWCTYLPRGKFSFEVITTEADKASGIQFFPVQQNIEVISQPLININFSQLRATLIGKIKCFADAPKTCTSAEVTLHPLSGTGQPTGLTLTTTAQSGQYSFKDLLPGPYEIAIPHSQLCYESTRILVNIATASETAPPFIHRGYEVSIISSHRAMLKYTFSAPAGQSPTIVDDLKLLAGLNTFCVPKYGSYNMNLESCHLYDESIAKTFSTAATHPIVLTAAAHKVGVRVLFSEADASKLQLAIESERFGKQVIQPTAEAHKVDGKYAFRYDTHLRPGETLQITPQSEVLLFTPQSKQLVGANDCVDIAFNFVATLGLILQGKVIPPIKDATITLSFPNNPETSSQSMLTSITGEFKFGPIYNGLIYELEAAKESYIFSAYNRETYSFNAQKLCEIVVSVTDNAGKPLNGVLLSLSGSESYRKNLITGENGAINFHSLSPSQYFLRPMMKEYKFDPNSKMIDVKDGETVEVELIGRRVAYSVFGFIRTLNGEPFPLVNIEAYADEQCMHHQEEATSESNGQYRLRGIQPGCTYTIQPKDIGTTNSNVARSLPASRQIKVMHDDIRDVNLIAISAFTFVDVVVRITAAENDYYKTLRLVIYRKGASDSPIYSQRVEAPINPKARFNPGIMVFLPRIPLDGKTYVTELKSLLSDKTYAYVLPVEQFVANTSSVVLELNFNPEVRTAEADLDQNSISALILLALVAIAFFKQDIAMDCLNFVWSRLNGIAESIAQRQRSNSKKDVRKNEPMSQKEIEQIAEQINAIKSKKSSKKI